MNVFATYLAKELKARQERNPNYSIRAFARSLAMDPSSLAQILKGKRRLSLDRMTKVITRLGLSGAELDDLLRLIIFSDAMQHAITDALRPSTNMEREGKGHRGIAMHWLHGAVLAAFLLDDFRSDVMWLRSRLAVDKTLLLRFLARLEREGWISMASDTWILKRQSYPAKTRQKTQAWVRTQQANAQRALAYMGTQIKKGDSKGFDRAFLSSMTFPLSQSQLQEIAPLMKSFQHFLTQYLRKDQSHEPYEEVYQLNMQLFPLTRPHGSPPSQSGLTMLDRELRDEVRRRT